MLLAEDPHLAKIDRIRKNPRGLVSYLRHPHAPQPVNHVLSGDFFSHGGPSPSLGRDPYAPLTSGDDRRTALSR